MKKIIFIFSLLLISLVSVANTTFANDEHDEDTVCPVTLLYFKAINNDGKVFLQWATATELNNEKFEIERSTDGIVFTKLKEVQGNGNSNQIIIYGFVDNSPITGKSYYRLKQIDYDGVFEYSPIVSLTFHLSTLTLIYPNPCSNELNITGASSIQFLGMEDTPDDIAIKTFDTSTLAPGIYTVVVNNKAYKILKQ